MLRGLGRTPELHLQPSLCLVTLPTYTARGSESFVSRSRGVDTAHGKCCSQVWPAEGWIFRGRVQSWVKHESMGGPKWG